MPAKTVPIELTVAEILAVLKAADLGAAIIKETGMVQNPASIAAAIAKVRRALPAR